MNSSAYVSKKAFLAHMPYKLTKSPDFKVLNRSHRQACRLNTGSLKISRAPVPLRLPCPAEIFCETTGTGPGPQHRAKHTFHTGDAGPVKNFVCRNSSDGNQNIGLYSNYSVPSTSIHYQNASSLLSSPHPLGICVTAVPCDKHSSQLIYQQAFIQGLGYSRLRWGWHIYPTGEREN